MPSAPESPPPLRVWIVAQLPPALARWFDGTPDVEFVHTFTLGLLGAEDRVIFDAARAADAVVLTKDTDFVALLGRHGPPPRIVLVELGNATNASLRAALVADWPRVAGRLRAGEPLVRSGARPG